MRDLLSDLRIAARQMARKPGIAVFIVLSLALGIGFNSSIFSLVNAVLLRQLPAAQPEELVNVYMGQDEGFRYATASHPDFADLRSWTRTLKGLAAFETTAVANDHDGRAELLFGEQVSGNYFDLLGLPPALGRSFTAEEDAVPGKHPVIILGHGFWQRRFAGDPGVLGRTLKLNGHVFTVIGVAPERLKGSFPAIAVDFWIPLAMSDALAEHPSLAVRDSRSLFLKGRLAPGVTVEQAQAELTALAARLAAAYPETDRGLTITAVPTRDVVFNPGIDRPVLGVAALVMALVGLVLVIACSNVANLLLVRAAERRREISIRLALGVGRGRLIRQLLTESLLLAAVGGGLGLLVALATARLLVSWKPPIPIPLNFDVSLDARVLAFTAGLTLLTGVLCGLAPALAASRPNLTHALKEEEAAVSLKHRRFGLRPLLVVAQVALSTLLLIGAGLFLRSLGKASSIDPGFGLRRGVAAEIALGLGKTYDTTARKTLAASLLERARALPGVRSAALVGSLPLGLQIRVSEVEIEGRPKPKKGEEPEADRTTAGPGYFETMGIPILAGRAFGESDETGPPVVVINQAAARRFWPGQDPLGRRLRLGEKAPWSTVVGVARDGKYRTLGEEARPFAYTPLAQEGYSFFTLLARTDGDERALLSSVRGEITALDPNLPVFNLKTMSEHLSIMLYPARFGAVLLTAFGTLGLVLAALGLYGVVATAAARRTKEIGIRQALGAERGAVIRLVLKEGMVLTGIGLALGAALAAAAGGVLSGLLYGIRATDPLTFAAVIGMLGLVAALAHWEPARRATAVEPSLALRAG